MRGILLFFVVVSSVYAAEETLSDLYELLKDPTLLSEIEKRLGTDFDDDLFSDVDGCYDTSGMASADCNFYANGSAIIKTSESIARGAEFLKEYVNISCPRDCTALCCQFPNCDTSVYQDKVDHKCYLFHCGDQSNCVFTQHGDYWTGSISKATHKSHSFAPGGSTYSHENELENLGSDHNDELPPTSASPSPLPPITTIRTTTTTVTTTTTTASLPGLGKSCPSYGSQCEDPHAVCLMSSCRCSVGYHEKHGICRKHCRNDEYECENYSYYSNDKECVPNQYVCDGIPHCKDASDENSCPDKTEQDENKPSRKPVNENGGNRNHPMGPHLDRVKPVNQPQTTIKQYVSTDVPTTAAPVPTPPPPSVRPVQPTNSPIVTPDSQPSINNDEDMEPVNKEEDKTSDNQLADKLDSDNSNNTESVEEKPASAKKYNILNAESMEVTSYTDSFQGPIVALALGLAITLILLIFVGCRLRTVKRRLRKGRALHSNEADYLINGMYL